MKNPENGKEHAEFHFEEITAENTDKLVELRSNTDNRKTLSELEAEAEKFAKGRDRKAFISIENGIPTGFVQVELEDPELPAGSPEVAGLDTLAHISRIAVDEKYRGKGIAKKLLEHAENWAREQGKEGMWLDYLKDNSAAAGLYESTGYKDVAEFIDVKKQKVRRIAIKHF